MADAFFRIRLRFIVATIVSAAIAVSAQTSDTAKQPLSSSAAADSGIAHPSTTGDDASILNEATVAAETTRTPSPQDIPESDFRPSRSAGIIAAIGTTVAIAGIIVIMFVKQSSEARDKEPQIPDPPPPPEY